jgi:hypothetical protein
MYLEATRNPNRFGCPYINYDVIIFHCFCVQNLSNAWFDGGNIPGHCAAQIGYTPFHEMRSSRADPYRWWKMISARRRMEVLCISDCYIELSGGFLKWSEEEELFCTVRFTACLNGKANYVACTEVVIKSLCKTPAVKYSHFILIKFLLS